jgi:hypothetical protein
MERRRDLQSLKFLNRKRRQAEFGNNVLVSAETSVDLLFTKAEAL